MRGDFEKKNGASEGIRTLDVHLGKVMLYQTELRSLPNRLEETKGICPNCKFLFSKNRAGLSEIFLGNQVKISELRQRYKILNIKQIERELISPFRHG